MQSASFEITALMFCGGRFDNQHLWHVLHMGRALRWQPDNAKAMFLAKETVYVLNKGCGIKVSGT